MKSEGAVLETGEVKRGSMESLRWFEGRGGEGFRKEEVDYVRSEVYGQTEGTCVVLCRIVQT